MCPSVKLPILKITKWHTQVFPFLNFKSSFIQVFTLMSPKGSIRWNKWRQRFKRKSKHMEVFRAESAVLSGNALSRALCWQSAHQFSTLALFSLQICSSCEFAWVLLTDSSFSKRFQRYSARIQEVRSPPGPLTDVAFLFVNSLELWMIM